MPLQSAPKPPQKTKQINKKRSFNASKSDINQLVSQHQQKSVKMILFSCFILSMQGTFFYVEFSTITAGFYTHFSKKIVLYSSCAC